MTLKSIWNRRAVLGTKEILKFPDGSVHWLLTDISYEPPDPTWTTYRLSDVGGASFFICQPACASVDVFYGILPNAWIVTEGSDKYNFADAGYLLRIRAWRNIDFTALTCPSCIGAWQWFYGHEPLR